MVILFLSLWCASGELRATSFRVDVEHRPAVFETRVAIELENTGSEAIEANVHLWTISAAAVTRADLTDGGRVIRGLRNPRWQVRDTYCENASKRHPTMRVEWDEAGWMRISIFPIAAHGRRRFDLVWIEPVARDAISARIVTPRLYFPDGTWTAPDQAYIAGEKLSEVPDVIRIFNGIEPAERASGRSAFETFGYLLTRGTEPAPKAPKRVVIGVETSSAVEPEDRARLRASIDNVLLELKPETEVTLFGMDWVLSPLVEGAPRYRLSPMIDRRLGAVYYAGRFAPNRMWRELFARAQAIGAERVVFISRNHFRSSAVQKTVLSEKIAPALRETERWYPLVTATKEVVWIARRSGAPGLGEVEALPSDLEALWVRASLAPVLAAVTPSTSIVAGKEYSTSPPPDRRPETSRKLALVQSLGDAERPIDVLRVLSEVRWGEAWEDDPKFRNPMCSSMRP